MVSNTTQPSIGTSGFQYTPPAWMQTVENSSGKSCAPTLSAVLTKPCRQLWRKPYCLLLNRMHLVIRKGVNCDCEHPFPSHLHSSEVPPTSGSHASHRDRERVSTPLCISSLHDSFYRICMKAAHEITLWTGGTATRPHVHTLRILADLRYKSSTTEEFFFFAAPYNQ